MTKLQKLQEEEEQEISSKMLELEQQEATWGSQKSKERELFRKLKYRVGSTKKEQEQREPGTRRTKRKKHNLEQETRGEVELNEKEQELERGQQQQGDSQGAILELKEPQAGTEA